MTRFVRRLISIMDRRSQRRFLWLFLATLVMALLQVIGVTSVLPFMTLVARPELAEENLFLQHLVEVVGGMRNALLVAGTAVLVLMAAANGFAVFTKWLQFRVSWGTAHGLGKKLLESYTGRTYEYFLTRNTAALTKQILAEVSQLVTGVVLPLVQLGAHLLVAGILLVVLAAVDVSLAVMVLGVIGGAYAVSYFIVRRHLARMGVVRLAANRERFQAVSNVLNGIKQIKIERCESYFTDRFVTASKTFTDVVARNQTIAATPRHLVETLAFGGIVAIVLYLLGTGREFRELIPTLTLYAVAGYRLLPSLQGVFDTAAKVRYNSVVVDEIYEELRDESSREVSVGAPPEEVSFTEAIEFRSVGYRYPESSEFVLKDLNITIPKGGVVAFVGSTGAGKTTLVDTLLGLLRPQEGQVVVDGRSLGEQGFRRLRELVGYVPQEVFLLDDTVTRNIAFGVPDELIDHQKVREVAATANIDGFVVSEMEDGYDSMLGERGVRLSGGQRQRIGLARALYASPELLVLDEATSALDGITEASVLRSIRRLPNQVTTLTIAHRLTTVKDADRIYVLEQGRVVASGTFEYLCETSELFQNMARMPTEVG